MAASFFCPSSPLLPSLLKALSALSLRPLDASHHGDLDGLVGLLFIDRQD